MPHMHFATTARLYTSRSATYDNSWHPSFALHMLETALSAASPLPSDTILLDLACGTGVVIFPAVQHLPADATIIGVDISPGMLHEARRKLSALPASDQNRVTLIEHDMENLESVAAVAELEGEVDIITCASAFVFIRGGRARWHALYEWSRLLKPGSGCIVFDVTHEHNLRLGLVMERVLEALDFGGPSERSWIRGRQSVVDLVGNVRGLELVSVGLKEQTGEGHRRFDAGEDVAVREFEKLMQSEAYSMILGEIIRLSGDVVMDQAKKLFVSYWREAAGKDGMVDDVDGVYVVVARRKSEEPT